jgi:hypothetical protein
MAKHPLLPNTATREDAMQALTALRPLLVNKVHDIVDESNEVRALSKLKHLKALSEKPLHEVITAYNLVVSLQAEKKEKLKAAFKIIITFGLSFQGVNTFHELKNRIFELLALKYV